MTSCVRFLPSHGFPIVAVFQPHPKGALERPHAYGAGYMGTYTPFHLRRAWQNRLYSIGGKFLFGFRDQLKEMVPLRIL